MWAGPGLPRFAQELLTSQASWKQLGFLTQALCFRCKTFFQGLGLFKSTQLCPGAGPFH